MKLFFMLFVQGCGKQRMLEKTQSLWFVTSKFVAGVSAFKGDGQYFCNINMDLN
jgi:hypothetical protein